MKILSISTSSSTASACISEDNKCIKELNINNLKTHSETLIPLIQELLDNSQLNLKDINVLACDIGPRFIYWYSHRNRNRKSSCRIFKYSNRFSFFVRSISI